MAGKSSKNNPYIPTEAREKMGMAGTNNITEGKDTGSWFMNDKGDVDTSRTTKEMVHDFNEARGYDQPEPLSGASGLIAKGNQGDNALANPDAEDTREVSERHNQELAQLQNAIGDTSVATGTISQTPEIKEESKVKEAEEPKKEGIGKMVEDANKEQSENVLQKAPESANLDFSDYLKNYYGPKNGADYLKALWSQGAGGKAQAIANVIGNILGATSSGAIGKDYKSDWQTYKDNYIKEMADRNQKAFEQNMEISRTLRNNKVARDELLNILDNYKKIGSNIGDDEFQNIRKALAATGNSSQLDYYTASILGKLASDPNFQKALGGASEGLMSLLGNVTQFAGNTMKPLNYIFGGLN